MRARHPGQAVVQAVGGAAAGGVARVRVGTLARDAVRVEHGDLGKVRVRARVMVMVMVRVRVSPNPNPNPDPNPNQRLRASAVYAAGAVPELEP